MKAANLVEMVNKTVGKFANKDAFLWKNNGAYQGISYKVFWEKVQLVAAGLVHHGIRRNDKVAILSENNPKWPICDLAIMSIGAVSVPIHSTLPSDQVTFILHNADCKFVFVENENQLQKIQHQITFEQSIAVLYPNSEFVETERVYSLSRLGKIGELFPLANWENHWKDITRNDIATIIHTSGTTGVPKGAMLTHGNILANVEGVQFWVLEARSSDILLSHLPLSHVFERMAGQFMPLYVGATIAYAESIDTVQQNLQEVKPTVMVSVPLLFERVYAEAQKKIQSGTPLRRKIFDWAVSIGLERYEFYLERSFDELFRNGNLPNSIKRKWNFANKVVYSKVKSQLGGRLRGLISGGGALNPEIAKFFWAVDLPVLEGYGLTETAPVICVNPMSRSKIGTVGKPLPNLEIKIAPDGEVMVKGPSVMRGYYNNQEETDKVLSNGWFSTGDIGVLDQDGFLKIIDRKKRIIVLTSGKNVAPQPVENAMNQSVFIENSVLIGQNKKYVIAIVSPSFENIEPLAKKKHISTNREELLKSKFLQDLLRKEVTKFTKEFPRHEQPKKIIIVGSVWDVETGELTPSLKVRVPEIEKKYSELIDRTYSDEENEMSAYASDEIAVTLPLSQRRG